MKKILLIFFFLIPFAHALSIQNLAINPSPNNPIKGMFIIAFNTDEMANGTVSLNTTSVPTQSQPDLTSFTFTYTTPPPDGVYTLLIQANTTLSGVQQQQSLIIDNTAPTVVYSLSTLTPQSSQSVEINATPADTNTIQQVNITGTSTKALTLSDGRWTALFTPANLGCASQGSCTLTLHVKDAAGNERIETIGLTLNSTAQPPRINLQLPLPNFIANNSYFLLKYSLNDSNPPMDTPLCTLNLYSNEKIIRQRFHTYGNYTHQAETHIFSQRVTGLSDGPYTFNLSCTNRANLTSSVNGFVTIIDKTNPSLISYAVDSFERRAYLSGEMDEEATVQIQYSTDASLLIKTPYESVSSSEKKFYHNFRNLQPGTLYYYQLTLQDSSNNRVTFGIYNFTTYSEGNASNQTTVTKGDYPAYLDASEVKHFSKKTAEILPDQPQKITFEDPSFSLTQIQFVSREGQPSSEILQFRLEKLPPEITLPPEEFYQGIYIHHPGLNDKKLQNIQLLFKVEKSWIAEKEYTKNSIHLQRYDNDLWIELPTQLLSEDVYTLTYQVNTPGLSLFAITANPAQKLIIAPANRTTPVINLSNTTQNPPDSSEESSFPWLWMILILIILSAVGTYLYLFVDLKGFLKKIRKTSTYATLELETPAQEPPREKTKNKDLPPNFQTLCDFVQKCIHKGLTDEKIKIGLQQKGWKSEHIEEALHRCRKL